MANGIGPEGTSTPEMNQEERRARAVTFLSQIWAEAQMSDNGEILSYARRMLGVAARMGDILDPRPKNDQWGDVVARIMDLPEAPLRENPPTSKAL